MKVGIFVSCYWFLKKTNVSLNSSCKYFPFVAYISRKKVGSFRCIDKTAKRLIQAKCKLIIFRVQCSCYGTETEFLKNLITDF